MATTYDDCHDTIYTVTALYGGVSFEAYFLEVEF